MGHSAAAAEAEGTITAGVRPRMPPGRERSRFRLAIHRYCPVEARIFLGIWLALLWLGPNRLFRDPGTFWHIIVGQRILESGHLIHTDPFSFTCQGQPWIAQEWLGECGLALVHRLSGLDGVLLATATVIAAFYTWVARRLLRAGLEPLLATLVVVLTLAASAPCLHPRPNLGTVIGLGITFAALAGFETGRWPVRRMFWLVPVYALWTNIHGGMLGGLGTIALAVAGWAVFGLRPAILKPGQLLVLAVLVMACAMTALVNPYGLALPRLWIRLIHSPALPQLIQEHAPLYRMPWAGIVLVLGAFYTVSLVSVPLRRIRVTWLLPLVWLYLSWTRSRHSPLFAITAGLALADMLPEARWMAWLARRGSKVFRVRGPEEFAGYRGSAHGGLLACGLLVAAAAALQLSGARAPLVGRGWVRLDATHWPVAALDDLRAYTKSHPSGTPVFNDMLFGGFLIYYTPELHVFIDDRCELYGDEMLREYAQAAWHDGRRIENWRERYGFRLALVMRDSAFDRYLKGAAHWQVLRRSQAGSLYRWLGPGDLGAASKPRGRHQARASSLERPGYTAYPCRSPKLAQRLGGAVS